MATASSSSSSSSFKKHQVDVCCMIGILFFFSTGGGASCPSIGVSMNPSVPGVPSSDLIVSAIGSAGIRDVLLQDPDVKTLRSFLYTNISLLISLPLFSNSSYTLGHQWISTHILPFHPRIHVSAISLTPTNSSSSNISSSSSSSSEVLLLSLSNFRSALIELGLPHIPISTVHSFNNLVVLLSPMFSPSSARFKEEDIRGLLEFLNSTDSPFLVDLYPFHLYRADPAKIPIGYVLFQQLGENILFTVDDKVTGLTYSNMFDAMVDALITALQKTGYGSMPIVVTGTGWPTAGSPSSFKYSFLYNSGLVDHLRFGLGTPMRREGVKAVYLYQLFDDITSSASDWGIWFANFTHKYEINFSSSSSSSQEQLFWATLSCLLLFSFLQLHH